MWGSEVTRTVELNAVPLERAREAREKRIAAIFIGQVPSF
jgi:hypothetical protein